MAERPYFHPDVYTDGLAELSTHGNRIYMCTQLPTDYTEASDTYAKGNKDAPTVGAPAEVGTSYAVTITAFTDGVITGEGLVSHWCLVDTVADRLLAARKLAVAQQFYLGNSFALGKEGGGNIALGFDYPAEEV